MISKYTVVDFTTTPKQLRWLADKMEKETPLKTLGDDTLITLFAAHDVTLNIRPDQDAYNASRCPKNDWSNWT